MMSAVPGNQPATNAPFRFPSSPDHSPPRSRRSPVSPPFSPNPWCTPPEGPLSSRWGKEIALQEASMAARQASLQSLKSIAGARLLALGLVLLFDNLDGDAPSLSNFAGVSVHEVLRVLPALDLA